MCNISEVLESSYRSAPVMTATLSLYGDGDMGKGIRKICNERFLNDFHSGYAEGFVHGEKTGYIKGALVAIAAMLTVEFSIGLIKKAIENHKLKKEAEQEEISAAS